MVQAKKRSPSVAERAALRKRVRQMHAALNRGQWERCFALLDPKLRDAGRVESRMYVENLSEFKNAYGSIHPWYTRVSVHLDASKNQRDRRPFAYVYVIWQDASSAFHMFKERWVKDGGQWYSRVVGLITHSATLNRAG
jgi:hypothetical protein